MSTYLKNAISERLTTPQSAPIPGREAEMVPNLAGGFTFQIDEFGRLERFLVLGSEGGTYYASERALTKQNLTSVEKAIALDGPRVVRMVVEISDAGRAPKNDPALLVLAMCAGSKDVMTRQLAMAALPKVARIGTHLFHFADYVQVYRGWGRALRSAVGKWYSERSLDNLIDQAIKYRQRDGWSHRDLLRLSHPKVTDQDRRSVFQWITHPDQAENVPARLESAIKLMAATNASEAVKLISEFNLPRECVPTDLLNEVSVWEALLEKMPMTALIRNLGKMSSIGLLQPLSAASKDVVAKLANKDAIRGARVHPMAVLMALRTYQKGHGEKGKLSWTAVSTVSDALDKAFYLAFKNVEPTGRNMLLALDVSGSMSSPVLGTPLSCREASAAMALVTANVEPNHHIVGFTASSKAGRGGSWGSRRQSLDAIRPLDISPKMRLDKVVEYMARLPFEGTDCSLPFIYATANKLEVDGFAVYTDNETWAGEIQPVQALQNYRKAFKRPAKSVVVGMSATNFTIADPNDPGMLDCVGFDSAAPQVIADFFRN